MADQEHMAAEALVAHRLLVHLGDERTGRVQIEEVARPPHRPAPISARHAPKRRPGMPVLGRDLRQLLDEHRAEVLQALDHIAVVHDLVAHIDRRAVFLQRQHDDLDRAVDAGAEAAGLAEPDRQRRLWRRQVVDPVSMRCEMACAGAAVKARRRAYRRPAPRPRHSTTPTTPASAAASPYQVSAYWRWLLGRSMMVTPPIGRPPGLAGSARHR